MNALHTYRHAHKTGTQQRTNAVKQFKALIHTHTYIHTHTQYTHTHTHTHKTGHKQREQMPSSNSRPSYTHIHTHIHTHETGHKQRTNAVQQLPALIRTISAPLSHITAIRVPLSTHTQRTPHHRRLFIIKARPCEQQCHTH
jgi:hypothetical protein